MGRKSIGGAAEEAAPIICGSEEVPVEFRRRYLDIVALTDEFCNERLDTEYQELCREIAIGLCQDGSPAERGKAAGWASGIVYTLGWVNFFSDPNTEPYLRSEEIAEWFGVSAGTMHSKSKVIRDGMDISPLDPEFTHSSRLDDNPFVWMVELTNGMIIDIRHAPRELQKKAYEHGMIPYIPADRETGNGAHEAAPAKTERKG
jgi:hypothetical protein